MGSRGQVEREGGWGEGGGIWRGTEMGGAQEVTTDG